MKTMHQPALGKRIAELRKIKGLTQEELVHKCNINVRTLQRIENGVVMPRSYTIKMIFEVLGSEIDLNEYMETSEAYKFPSNLIAWIKNQYAEMNEWLKQNNLSMKKISMISVLAFATLVFITAVSMNKGKSYSAKDNITGNWVLYAVKNGNKPTKVLVPRFMKINKDQTFVSSTIEGNIYNSGVYYLTSDSTLVTIHNDSNGNLQKTANLYDFTIKNDTLNFSGYYMGNLVNDRYQAKYINEIWVKTKEFNIKKAGRTTKK